MLLFQRLSLFALMSLVAVTWITPAFAQFTISVPTDDAKIQGSFVDGTYLRVRLAHANPQDDFILPLKITLPTPPVAPTTGSTTLVYKITKLVIKYGDRETQDIKDSDLAAYPLSIPSAYQNRTLTIYAEATFEIHEKRSGEDDAVASDEIKKTYPDTIVQSEVIRVKIDTLGPHPSSINVERNPGGGGVLRITLEDTDLEQNGLATSNFDITHLTENSDGGDVTLKATPDRDPTYDAGTKTITLTFAHLNPGNHEVVITGLKDRVGNKMSTEDAAKVNTFLVPGGRQRGDHVPFPEYLQPNGKTEGFSPAHRVDSRVARTYYFRNAHRILEIINRKVRSFNQVGVDEAQRIANEARTTAENSTDERRQAEAVAIRAAQKTRATRASLERAQSAFTEAMNAKDARQTSNEFIAQQIDEIKPPDAAYLPADPPTEKVEQFTRAIETIQTKIRDENAKSPANDAEKDEIAQTIASLQATLTEYRNRKNTLLTLTSQESQNDRAITRLEQQITTAQTTINDSQNQLTLDQQAEIAATDKVPVAEAREERARKEQFRREVAAGLSDPDTYVAGDINSVDPVTQVSMSVIGEGVIQLRGPIKGINKIRRMIHQIDVPVGQVKVGIHKVQVNGEHGDRMELVYEEIDKHIALSKSLSHETTQLFRKAVSVVASEVAHSVERGEYQLPLECENIAQMHDPAFIRQLKYTRAFFGDDFIGELQRMDSELLQNGNMLLGLSSMDTLSLSQAMFVTALAKNSVRLRIIETFQWMVQSDLPQYEVNFYKTLTQTRYADPFLNRLATKFFQDKYDEKDAKRIFENAARTYHFSNFIGFFDTQVSNDATMNNMQFAILRLAQVLKAQLVAEMEYKNLVLERSLLEKNEGEIERKALDLDSATEAAEEKRRSAEAADERILNEVVPIMAQEVTRVVKAIETHISTQLSKTSTSIGDELTGKFRQKLQPHQGVNCAPGEVDDLDNKAERLLNSLSAPIIVDPSIAPRDTAQRVWDRSTLSRVLTSAKVAREISPNGVNTRLLNAITDSVEEIYYGEQYQSDLDLLEFYQAYLALITLELSPDKLPAIARQLIEQEGIGVAYDIYTTDSEIAERLLNATLSLAGFRPSNLPAYREAEGQLKEKMNRTMEAAKVDAIASIASKIPELRKEFQKWVSTRNNLQEEIRKVRKAEQQAEAKNELLFSKRLLDQFIDEQEEKSVALMEALRSHASNIDNYLKRLAIALEDDINAQFYDPAFQDIRRASRYWDVSLGQIETTTVLTNNRNFAKVTPSATIEFDLPHRDILYKEALEGAQAIMQEYGTLTQDGTFLAAAGALGGQPAAGLPDSQSPMQQIPGLSTGVQPQFGSALEKLIPDPSVYKFETGVGFEIRPVIQPDGHSIVYRLNYMDTTNVREPVRADEKHLGRVKRHFINTDVQTSSYELREVGRYTVAVKASRTSRGVPLFEDIPLIGAAFRPLPSDESSLQESIVLASSVIYPTMYDLMGLRWSPYADDVNSDTLRGEKLDQRYRRHEMREQLLMKTRRIVNGRIGLQSPAHIQEDPVPGVSQRRTVPDYRASNVSTSPYAGAGMGTRQFERSTPERRMGQPRTASRQWAEYDRSRSLPSTPSRQSTTGERFSSPQRDELMLEPEASPVVVPPTSDRSVRELPTGRTGRTSLKDSNLQPSSYEAPPEKRSFLKRLFNR